MEGGGELPGSGRTQFGPRSEGGKLTGRHLLFCERQREHLLLDFLSKEQATLASEDACLAQRAQGRRGADGAEPEAMVMVVMLVLVLVLELELELELELSLLEERKADRRGRKDPFI